MKAIPRRLLVLGGGPAGVDLAHARVALAARWHSSRPAPLGEAPGEVLRRDGVELVLGVRAAPPIWFVSGHPRRGPCHLLAPSHPVL